MGVLSDLLHRANHANGANGPTIVGCDSQDSQHSHVCPQLREGLRHAATAARLPADLVAGLDDADVTACAGYSPDALRAFLRARARSQRMAAGLAPEGWTRLVVCAGCGPVLLWTDAPASVIGCPWCWHRKAGRMVPRLRGG